MRLSKTPLKDVRPASEDRLGQFLVRTHRPEAFKDPPTGVTWRYIGELPVCPPGDDCWIWGGGHRNGIPYFAGAGGWTPAARWAYVYINQRTGWEAADPEERFYCVRLEHKCGNKQCVNPKHIIGKTQSQLLAERVEANKQREVAQVAQDRLLGTSPQRGPWGPRETGVLRLDEAERGKVLVRISSKCAHSGDCLVWKGPIVSSRPAIVIRGRLVGCARVLWELKHRKPCDVVLRDGCRTTGCINPDHKRAWTGDQAGYDAMAVEELRRRLGIDDAPGHSAQAEHPSDPAPALESERADGGEGFPAALLAVPAALMAQRKNMELQIAEDRKLLQAAHQDVSPTAIAREFQEPGAAVAEVLEDNKPSGGIEP